MIHDAQTEDAPELVEVQQRGTILIVDDAADQTFVLARCLEKIGFAVAIEHEGRAGLARAAIEPPDLVLLDLELPDIDGFEVCRELVDAPETCGMPVITVSGHDQADIVRACRAAGSEFFVRKPFDPNVLLTLIESMLASW